MTINSRNIVELSEIDPSVTNISEIVSVLNENIVELNFILRQMTMNNLDGDIKKVTLKPSITTKISHRLKTIPRHRIILKQSGGGVITDGQFTSNYIELINSGVTDANITIIILKE